MSVLDLCELDNEGLLSNNLRRLWILGREQDPVHCARLNKQRWWVIVVSVWVTSLFVVILHLAILTDSRLLLLFGITSGMVFWACGLVYGFVCFTAGKRADEFSRLLQQAASIWMLNPGQVAAFGMEQLMKAATGTLCEHALILQQLEQQGQRRETIEAQRRWFKDAHRVFLELGLAGDKWDSYFKEEPKEEPPPAEVKES